MEMDTNNPPVVSPETPIPMSEERKVKRQKGYFLVLSFIVLLLIVATGAYYLGTLQVSSSATNADSFARATALPTLSNTPGPTPDINYPEATVTSLKGKLVIKYKNYILISEPNGTNPMKLIGSNNKVGFAGWSDDGRVFYYTELVDTTGTVNQKDLSTGLVTELFTFDSSGKNDEFFDHNVAVSPDGNYALYSHNNGDLSLYDLKTQSNKQLFTHKECLAYNSKQNNSLIRPVLAALPECYGYYYPYWSPDNKRALVRKILYEGATQMVINPLSSSVEETNLLSGTTLPKWLSRGDHILLPGNDYGYGSLYLVDNLENPIKTDLLTNTEYSDSTVFSSVMSGANSIAFSYATTKDGKNEKGIALYDLGTKSIRSVSTDFDEDVQIHLWLPDDKTLLYTKLFGNVKGELWSLDTTTLQKQKMPIMAQEVIGMVE